MASVNYNAENKSISPESLIVPPEEDINTNQEHISGERFPDNILELCDKCHWCCTCFNAKGLVDPCPLCGAQDSHIPMTLDEVCVIEYVGKQGLTLIFSRKQPLR
jgi:hypothetical protein